MNEWRFMDSGACDGATNMAVDAAVLEGVDAGTSVPTVRVYSWQPPTVSTGNSQRASEELDLEACRRAGFGVVRRPTGGRAVLHSGELTYSVVGRAGVPPLGGSIAETYESIAAALLLALDELGVQAELAPVATQSRRRGGAAPPCFASAGRFEVVVAGKKLVGSAQRRRGGAVLQHGSLLMDGTHTRLVDVMNIGEGDREALRRSLAGGTTDLSSLLGGGVDFAEVAGAVRSGFERAWGIRLCERGLTRGETERVRELASGSGDRR